MDARRYEYDWLRVITILFVFVFHCMLFFSKGDWHLKNPVQSEMLDVIIGFLWSWMMPTFFLVSGTASWFVLEKRTAGGYLLDRVKRLIVPLFTVGFFLMLPPQFYFDLVTHAQFTGSFWDSIPLYFSNVGIGLDHGPYIILTDFYGHLWFLIFLFFMCIMVLPLLVFLKSESGKNMIHKLATICSKAGGMVIFLIPLILIKIALEGVFTSNDSWADFFFYTAFFLLGYIIPSDRRFTVSLKQCMWLFLIGGSAGFAAVGFFKLGLGYDYPTHETFSTWMYFPFQVVISVTQLGLVLFVTGFGMKYLCFTNAFLTYSNEAVFPFYILHQTVILIIGWFIRPWNIALFPKFMILVSISFIVTVITYEFFIRRINVVRVLFGMRMRT